MITWEVRREDEKNPGWLGKARLEKFVLLAALETVILATVETFETVRRKFFWGQPPIEGFPWEEQPEIEPETCDEYIKLYPD